MSKTEEVLEVLRALKRKHGKQIPLSLIFKAVIKKGIYSSRGAIASCLRRLQAIGKIRPVKFGVNIELLESVPVEYTQSSLLRKA